MREILFRGKLLAGTSAGEWVYGNLVIKPGQNVAIITPDDTPIGRYGRVDPSTVGQYTGLRDKNGVRIFEGDILRSVGRCGTLYSEIRIGECLPGVLQAYEKENGLALRRTIAPHCLFASGEEALLIIGSNGTAATAEVAGNIYDNPELMDGGEAP